VKWQFYRSITKKEINGTEMHIKSAKGEKTVKNMETFAYS
jgi:hypothetical protein